MLMPRFNQRVNTQTGPFCELRHKIYLIALQRPGTGGTTNNTAPAEPGRCCCTDGLELGALKRAGSVNRRLAQHPAALVEDNSLPGRHPAEGVCQPDHQLPS